MSSAGAPRWLYQTSVANPKFAISRGSSASEFRIQSHTSNLLILVWFSDLKFLNVDAMQISGTSNPPHWRRRAEPLTDPDHDPPNRKPRLHFGRFSVPVPSSSPLRIIVGIALCAAFRKKRGPDLHRAQRRRPAAKKRRPDFASGPKAASSRKEKRARFASGPEALGNGGVSSREDACILSL